MPTHDELMTAAGRARAAGDAKAFRALVGAAMKMGQSVEPARPPRADDPAYSEERRAPDNLGDTFRGAVKGPAGATKAFARGVFNPEQSITGSKLPENMPDTAKAVIGGVGDAAMTGLSGVGTLYAGAAGAFGEVFGGSPTNEKKLARDVMMMGEVAVPQLAGGSSVVAAGNRAAGAAAKAAKAPTESQQAARAASDLGITPSLAMQGKKSAMISAAMEKTPVTASQIAKDATRAVGEIEGAFNTLTSKVGQATGPNAAGSALQGGLNKFVDGFKKKSSQMYAKVEKNIPADTQIAAPNTVAKIREALAPFDSNPEIATRLGLDKWAKIADALEQGLSWKAASDLRSQIGGSIGKMNGPLSDMDGGKLKQAYSSLTDDLGLAAKNAGPEAEAAWKSASKHYAQGSKRIQKHLDKTIRADSPERAFEAFTAMTKADRAAGDIGRMRKIKASLPKGEWKEVSSSIVSRLGKANAGAQDASGDVFSPAKFLTEWNKMSPEAKKILLPDTVKHELDKLAQVATQAKAAGAERNFSNTGNVAGQMAMGGALVAAPTTTVLSLAGLHVSARSMTNPLFLNALNKAARGDARHIKAMSKGRGPFAEDARTILRMSGAEMAGQNGANQTTAPVKSVSN